LGEDDLKAYKKQNVEVYIVPKAERDRWEAKLAPYRDKHIAGFEEFGQKVMKIVNEANKRHPYSERGMY
jgi:hypothetical protein